VTSDPVSALGPQEHGGDLRRARGRFARQDFLDFSASINPLGMPPGLWEHLLAVWETLLHYPEPHSGTLVDAVATRFRLAQNQVLVGNGSAELIDLLLRSQQWRRLVICPPDFSLYHSLAPAAVPVKLVPRLREQGFAPDLEALAEQTEAGDLILFSNPGNPAGSTASRERLRALLEHCTQIGATLALDEAFADFCPECSLIELAGSTSHLLVLRSLTKFYAIPGLRAGYLAGASDLVAAAAGLQVPWSVNALAQAAGVFCLAQQQWEERSLRYVAVERERLQSRLADLPGVSPQDSRANYMLVRVTPPAPSATELYEDLARKGFLIRHCGSFGLGEEFVRIAVRTREENEGLLEALQEVLSSRATSGSEPSRRHLAVTG